MCLIYPMSLFFLYPINYALQIGSCLEMGHCAHFPFTILRFFFVLNLCRFCAYGHNLCEIICVSTLKCLEYGLFPWSGRPPQLLKFFSRFLWEKICDKNILFRAEWSKVSHALKIVQFCVFVLITICWKKKFLLWGLSKVLSIGIEICN